MNYPVWDQGAAGGGLLIALIAVLHVFIAHFAVGAAPFLVLLESRAARDESPMLMGFVRKNARRVLVLSLVLGAVTGVGIWFTISVLSPQATASLVSRFVFAWAAEWLFFFTEIVALLLYYYLFDRLARRDHIALGWCYAVAAWMSLFLINGILGHMMTPGGEETGFWVALFGPSSWPSLMLRTLVAAMMAGCFAALAGALEPDAGLRRVVLRRAGLWMALPVPLAAAAAVWYFRVLPTEAQDLITGGFARVAHPLRAVGAAAALLAIGGGLLAWKPGAPALRPAAGLLFVAGFLLIGCFEWAREGVRKPWIIHGRLYSNSIAAADVETLNRTGILRPARWADREGDAGREIFRLECAACHAVGGPMNDILPRVAAFDQAGLEAFLGTLGEFSPHMPPFVGTEEEKAALAAYLAGLEDGGG